MIAPAWQIAGIGAGLFAASWALAAAFGAKLRRTNARHLPKGVYRAHRYGPPPAVRTKKPSRLTG